MLKIMHPDGAREWRYIALDHMRVGVHRLFDIDVVSTGAVAGGRLAATAANRVEVSDDGGATWTPLGTDITTGFDLGAFTPGQRKRLNARVTIPTGPAREEGVGFETGEGT